MWGWQLAAGRLCFSELSCGGGAAGEVISKALR